MMDVILATIFDGVRAIRQNTSRVVELNSLSSFFIVLYKTKPKHSCPTPSKEVAHVTTP
jgi:hypothetical protein